MATRDFRSQQIRVTQIIASGTNVSNSPSLLIYSASSATNDQGSYQASMLSGAGEDNWLFISGSTNALDGHQVLFGGNIVVSGSVSGSSFAGMPGGSVDIVSDDDIKFKSAGTEFFQIKNDTQDEVVVNDGGNDIDFRVETNQMKSAIHVNANQDLVVIGRRADPSDLTSASSPAVGDDVVVFIDGSANTKDSGVRGSTLVAGDLVVSGTLYAERQVMEVDLSQTGNLVMSGAVHFDDLGAAPGDSGQTTIAVPINDGALFVATGSLRFRTTTNGTDFIETNVGAQYVAGNGLESTTVGSTTTFETDDTIVAHLTGSQFSGNVGITGSLGASAGIITDTISSRTNSSMNISSEGGVTLTLDSNQNDSQRYFIINNGDGTAEHYFGDTGEVWLNYGRASTGDFQVRGTSDYALIFSDAGENAVALGWDGDTNPEWGDLTETGTDVKVLLSGSVDSKDTGTRGVTLAAGDMVVSGTLYYADDSSSESYLSSPGNGLSRDINSSVRTIELSLNDVSGSASIASGDTLVFIDADASNSTKKGTVGSLVTAIAGDGLEQGGNQLNVSVDNSTIEINSDTLRVKDDGITAAKINSDVAGTGLEQHTDGSIRIAAAAAGDGLNGGAGSALSVDAGNGLKIGSSSDVITDDAVVAHLSGSEFNGHVGITGSLAVDGDMSLTVNSVLRFNNPGENDQTITGNNSTLTIDADNYLNISADLGVNTIVGSPSRTNQFGTSTNEFNTNRYDVDFEVNTDDYYATLLVDGGDNSIILGHEGFDSTPSASEADGYGDDVKIMLSGSAGSKDGSTRGVVLVPGDMVISGTLYDGDGERISLLSISENGTFSSAPSATGTNSVAIGAGATASQASAGHSIVAGGLSNTASGDYSATLGGQSNTAGGDWSVAMGRSNNVTGDDSVAIGKSLTVSDSNTIAIGNNTNNAKIALSGSVETFGNITTPEYIYHSGDSGTYLRFVNNGLKLNAGGDEFLSYVKSDSTIFYGKSTSGSPNHVFSTVSGSNAIISHNQVLILSGGNASSYDEASGADVAFFVSGSSESRGTNIKGTSVFGGDVHISGALSGPSQYSLTDSTVRIFRDGSTMKFVDGVTTTKTLEELASVAASVDHFIGVHGADASLSKLKTTASIAFSGDKDAFVDGMAADGVGSDVFFFVSGTLGSKDGTTRHASLFGGDVVVSGSTHLADLTSSYIMSTGEIVVGGNVIRNSNDDANIRLSSSDNKVFIGSQYDTAPQSLLDIRKDDNTGITSGVDGNTLANFNIALRNHSTANNAFVGIAFDVADEQDTDRIGASIAGVRTTTDADNHQTDLRFYTNVGDNDGGIDDGLTERLRIKSDGKIGVGTDPSTTFHISGQDSLVIPIGTTAQRGTNTQGGIRYNTDLSAFEGYSGTAWSSLGGVKDVDGDTYISAETTSGADNDDLIFFTAGINRMTIDNTGAVGITGSLDVSSYVDVTGDITGSSIRSVTGQFSAADGKNLKLQSALDVQVFLDIDNNGGQNFEIYNGATTEILSLDESGNLQIDGDLTVSGDDIKDSGGNTVISFDGAGTVDNQVQFTGNGHPSTNPGDIKLQSGLASIDQITSGLFFTGTGRNIAHRAVGADFLTLLNPSSGQNELVVNEAGEDHDFRVETDTNTHTLFVRGSDNNVGIRNSNPSYPLDVSGDIRLSGDLRLDGNQIIGTALELDSSGDITLDADSGTITFADNGVSLGTITSTGYSGNAASADTIDTTATSTDSAHYLTFVDSSSSTSGETLRVNSGLAYNPSTNNLTISGDLTVTGNDIIGTALKLDSSGDITLSADGDQIFMDDGTTTRFTFNVDSTPELDVVGDFTLDVDGTIAINSNDGASLVFSGSSGTSTATTLKLGTNRSMVFNTSTGTPIFLGRTSTHEIDTNELYSKAGNTQGDGAPFAGGGFAASVFYAAAQFAGNVKITPFTAHYAESIDPAGNGESNYWTISGGSLATTPESMTNYSKVTRLYTGTGPRTLTTTYKLPGGVHMQIHFYLSVGSSVPDGGSPLVLQYSENGTDWSTIQSFAASSYAASSSGTQVDIDFATPPASDYYLRFYQGQATGTNSEEWEISAVSIRENEYDADGPLIITHPYLKGGRMETTAYFTKFESASGSSVGSIYASSTTPSTVVYSTFTGAHAWKLNANSTYEEFMIGKIVATEGPTEEPIYVCEPTTSANDKSVVGILMSDVVGNEEGDENEKHRSLIALGNYKMLVCDEGGNIDIGDFISSSNTKGAGMKQATDNLMNYTFAKATEAVDWSSEAGTTKIISCILLSG